MKTDPFGTLPAFRLSIVVFTVQGDINQSLSTIEGSSVGIYYIYSVFEIVVCCSLFVRKTFIHVNVVS